MNFLKRLRRNKDNKDWIPIIGEKIVLTEFCLKLNLREAAKEYVFPGMTGEIVDIYKTFPPRPDGIGGQAWDMLAATNKLDDLSGILASITPSANKIFYSIKINDYIARDMPRWVDGKNVFVKVKN